MLHKRSRNILYKILTGLQGSLTVKQIADEYKYSPRAVRYDLEAIDGFLKEHGLPALGRKGGLSFYGSDTQRATAIQLIETPAFKNNTHMPEDRLHQVISVLLKAQGYITYEEIAKKIDVSKNTIVNDVNKLRAFYPYKTAMLEVTPRYGVCFLGDEGDIRESVIFLLSKHSGVHDLLFSATGSVDVKWKGSTKEECFARCIKTIAKNLNARLSDNGFIHLLLYMVAASARINAGHLISGLSKTKASEECQQSAMLALSIMAQGVSSEAEKDYLAGLIANCFSKKFNNRAEVQILLLNLVSSVEALLGINLMQDTELLKILDTDIQDIAGSMAMYLPVYENIETPLKEHYPHVHKAVSASVHVIEEYIGRNLTKEELIHLMIPFASAVVRKHTLSAKSADILVVCGAGYATSRLLSYQLLSLFNVNIVDTIDFNQLEESTAHNHVDLIISTVPLGFTKKPNIMVSPFLTPQDIKVLKASLPTKVIDHNIFTNLIKAIEQNCEIHNPQQLAMDIEDILNIKGLSPKKEELSLKDVLPASNIMINQSCNNWRKAVSVAGDMLVQSGCALPQYIEEMLNNVEQNGAYIVIAKGVAMPHAGLKSVNHAGMSLVQLKTPVPFGNPHNDPVDLVFAFCTPTKLVHLKALRQFSNLIGDKQLLKQIREATSVNEIVNILEML